MIARCTMHWVTLFLGIWGGISLGAEPAIEPALPSGNLSPYDPKVALSADGRRVLTVAVNVLLWDAASGKQLQTFGESDCAALSADGTVVVTGGPGASVILWNAATGKQIRTLRCEGLGGPMVVISADKRWVLAGLSDGRAVLWNATTGAVQQTFRGHESRLMDIGLSDDGRWVVTASIEGRLILWDAETGQQAQTYQAEPRRSARVAIAPDGGMVATGGTPGEIIFWDRATGKRLQTLAGHPGSMHALAFTGDSTKLLVCPEGGNEAALWDIASGTSLQTFRTDDVSAGDVAVSADGSRVILGTSFAPAILFDARTGETLQQFGGRTAEILAQNLSSGGRWIVTRPLRGHTLFVRDALSGEKSAVLEGHRHSPHEAVFFADGRRLLSGAGAETIVWDVPAGQPLGSPWEGPSNSLAVSADGRWALTGAFFGRHAELWNVATGTPRQRLPHDNFVREVALSTDGSRALTGSADKTAALWDTATGQRLHTFPCDGTATGVALSNDGSRLVTVDSRGATVRDLSGNVLQTMEDFSCGGAAFSPDEKRLLCSDFLGPMSLWEVATGQRLQRFHGHTAEITSMALTPDGRRLWSSSRDGTLRLWDVASGKVICIYMSLNDGEDWLAVTPDGLFDGSEGGMALMGWRETATGHWRDDEATRARCHRPGLLNACLHVP